MCARSTSSHKGSCHVACQVSECLFFHVVLPHQARGAAYLSFVTSTGDARTVHSPMQTFTISKCFHLRN